MRTYRDDTLPQVLLEGSFSTRMIADSFTGPERTNFDLGVEDWALRWDRDGNMKASGTLSVVETTDYGTTLRPIEPSDPLAPFGQEINLLMEVSSGSFAETVQIGHYRIAHVPRAIDTYVDFAGELIVAASQVDLTLEDRLSQIERRGFATEENPVTTSAWAELARITGMQIIRSVADVTLPTDFVYQAVRGGRLKAVRAIAALLGGTEYTTADGALSVLPATPSAPVGTLKLGEEGTILGDSGGMSSRDFYNVVVGDYETAERLPIHVVSRSAGQYSPDLIPESTYYHSNPAIKTLVDATAENAAKLAEVSRPAQRIAVDAVFNPLAEPGDVWTVERQDGSTVDAQIVSMRWQAKTPARMTMEMDVVA